MTFDPSIGLGAILTIAVLVFGGIGAWFTIKIRLDMLWKRSESNDTQHDENQKRMATIELQIARDCVKVEDFRRLDDKMTARFEKLEHTVGNSAAKTVQAVKEQTAQAFKDAVREILPALKGRE